MKLLKTTKFYAVALLVLSVFFAQSCGDDDGGNEIETLTLQVVEFHADLVLASYQDALTTATTLQTAIQAMTDNPNASTYNDAKEAWLAAREIYGQTEVYRFYGGPIDDDNGPEGQLNAWPLDESYIDTVAGATNGDNPSDNDGTNIINSIDDFPTISASVIAGLNEEGGETNVSSGYHAIEFLLWGQDVSPGAGGGERTFADYVDGSAAGNEDRRATYINAVAELIVSDLSELVAEWSSNGTYRAFFTSSTEANNSLERILTGMAKLSTGELSRERMAVALNLRSKEDEHSCFSDNTHRDIVTNALGIDNVYFGRYRRLDGSILDGPGVNDIAVLVNAELDTQMQALLTTTSTAVNAIQAPFDQEILGDDTAPGRIRVRASVDALRAQGDQLAAIAAALGFTVDPSDV